MSTTINQTFAIPTGVYTAGFWQLITTGATGPFTVSTDSGAHSVTDNSPTNFDSVIPISSQQLADVNAAAGGNLPASVVTTLSSVTLAGTGWTLQLTAVGMVVNSLNLPWTKLGITVASGQGITLQCSGSMTQDGNYCYPEGTYGDTVGNHADQPGMASTTFNGSPSNYPAPNCRPFSLVFATGATMPAQANVTTALQADRTVSFTAAQVGGQTLWASFNDSTTVAPPSGFFDNIGSFTISIVTEIIGGEGLVRLPGFAVGTL